MAETQVDPRIERAARLCKSDPVVQAAWCKMHKKLLAAGASTFTPAAPSTTTTAEAAKERNRQAGAERAYTARKLERVGQSRVASAVRQQQVVYYRADDSIQSIGPSVNAGEVLTGIAAILAPLSQAGVTAYGISRQGRNRPRGRRQVSYMQPRPTQPTQGSNNTVIIAIVLGGGALFMMMMFMMMGRSQTTYY